MIATDGSSAAVVDTDVVSFLFKNDTRAKNYQAHLTGRLLVVSFMTVAELDRWAIEYNWGQARRDRMEQHLRNFVVHPFDRSLCTQWAAVTDEARRNGFKIHCADAWIAATALHHQIPLITNNAKDYRGLSNLQIITEP